MDVGTGVFVGVIVAVDVGDGVAVSVGWNIGMLEQPDNNNTKTTICNKYFMKVGSPFG